MLKSIIKKFFFDPDCKLLPLSNKADILRAVTIVNQFQFLRNSSKELTLNAKTLFLDIVKIL